MRQRLAGWVLRMAGWRIAGELPSRGKCVVIAAPHTSNWDFPLGLTAAAAFGIRVSWLGKDTVFRRPFGGIMRRLGGIPVHRDRSEGVVGQAVAAFAGADSLILAIAPEGTRSLTPFWKSGFYHIAVSAGVPIYPVYIDRTTRRVGAGPALHPTGNLRRDMDVLRSYYATARGIRPDNAGATALEHEG